MYGHLLQRILLKLLPEDLVLDFNRKQLEKKEGSTFDVMELLQFLKAEIVCRESAHLKLVAVETIFGWCLQGRNSENQSLLALSVIVQENLISDQLKKFWDLEVSGLIESKNESNVSENQIMKNFESNIKHDEKAKRYKLGLPWKLEARGLKDNREIAEKRFTRLRKQFQKNPHLYHEYQEVLQNYLKQGIIYTKAFGTVAYLRVTSSNKKILTSFVASKNKIAPLKTLTLPRLELMGALLSARLSSNILKALKLDIPCFFWTDSKITYFWVRGQPERF
ncbi:uncharacterized protein TNIN_445931 [Trichonephila inaurata madagascariensis]|uniref:Uncharacterized protein n=1 Tax=Trichonephila inaurata madagascariensis TaxID=2747483 RepID=A0A8X6YKC0_9ARAC|nr:uncharacterized protein TNIN_445931 [Trichonephila inaurata madagascariensis]